MRHRPPCWPAHSCDRCATGRPAGQLTLVTDAPQAACWPAPSGVTSQQVDSHQPDDSKLSPWAVHWFSRGGHSVQLDQIVRARPCS
eukprot:183977-Chlamydomonas_euryale.AAC.4